MTLTRRQVTREDLPFLRALYATTRAEEVAQMGLHGAQAEAFLHMQFAAQHAHYSQHYAHDDLCILEQNATPIGRLYVGRWPREIRLIDISLLPPYRNQGIGSTLIQELLEEANKTQKPVRLHVARHNPAQRLYTRLGFREMEDRGPYSLMERPCVT